MKNRKYLKKSYASYKLLLGEGEAQAMVGGCVTMSVFATP